MHENQIDKDGLISCNEHDFLKFCAREEHACDRLMIEMFQECMG